MARCGGGSSSNNNNLAVVGINGRTASAVDDAAVPPPAVLSSLSTRVTILITIICTIAAAQTISNKQMTIAQYEITVAAPLLSCFSIVRLCTVIDRRLTG